MLNALSRLRDRLRLRAGCQLVLAVNLAGLFGGSAAFQVDERVFDTDAGSHMHFVSFARDSLSSLYRDAEGNHYAYYIHGRDVGLALTRDGVEFRDQGVVLEHDGSSPVEWTSNSFPSVWKDGDRWYLVTEAIGTPGGQYPGAIMLCDSRDGRKWTRRGLILQSQGPLERNNVGTPWLAKRGDDWLLYYHGYDGSRCQIFLATGPDLNRLRRANGGAPIIAATGGDIFAGQAGKRAIIEEDGVFYMVYEVSSAKTGPNFDYANYSCSVARSTDLVHWSPLGDVVIPIHYAHPDQRPGDKGYGHDGPDWFRAPDGGLHIYFRASGNRSQRATLRTSPASN